VPEVAMEDRIAQMRSRVEALAGKTARVPTMEAAREFVAGAIAGKTAVASNAPYLVECGISSLPGVRTGIGEVGELTGVEDPLLAGQAKAMVVVGSRLEAVRWQLAVNRYIKERGYAIATLVGAPELGYDEVDPALEGGKAVPARHAQEIPRYPDAGAEVPDGGDGLVRR